MVVIPFAVRLGVDGRCSERQRQRVGLQVVAKVTVDVSVWRRGRARRRDMRVMKDECMSSRDLSSRHRDVSPPDHMPLRKVQPFLETERE